MSSNSTCWSIPDRARDPVPKAHGDDEFKSEHLGKEMSLPYIPQYGPAAQFLRGTNFPGAKGGASITMHYTCKDDKSNVLSFYRNALQSNKWAIDRSMSNQASVSAKKDKYMCQVMVMQPSRKGSQCDYVLRYKFIN